MMHTDRPTIRMRLLSRDDNSQQSSVQCIHEVIRRESKAYFHRDISSIATGSVWQQQGQLKTMASSSTFGGWGYGNLMTVVDKLVLVACEETGPFGRAGRTAGKSVIPDALVAIATDFVDGFCTGVEPSGRAGKSCISRLGVSEEGTVLDEGVSRASECFCAYKKRFLRFRLQFIKRHWIFVILDASVCLGENV